MEITEEQYQQIAPLFPVARGRGQANQLGSPQRRPLSGRAGLPGAGFAGRFGPWHTVYMRWRRWNEQRLLARVFAELPELSLPAESCAVLGLDSTSVKVPPDATGAPKIRGHKPWPSPTPPSTTKTWIRPATPS